MSSLNARNQARLGGNPRVAVSQARRELLEQIRLALISEPAAFGVLSGQPDDRMEDIRGMASVRVGHIVMRLNRLGFAQSDRLYRIRDKLAAGRPIGPENLQWLETAIAGERAVRD